MTDLYELHIPDGAMRFTSQILEWMYGATGEGCGPLLTKDAQGPVLRGTAAEFHRLCVMMAAARSTATDIATAILDMGVVEEVTA